MLRWNADFGEKNDYWLAKIREGQRAPDQFYDRPTLDELELFYYNAFHELSTERQYGMSVGPIPRSKAREYAVEYGIDFDFFWSVIRRVDSESMKMSNARDKDVSSTDDDTKRSAVAKRERMKKRPLQDK